MPEPARAPPSYSYFALRKQAGNSRGFVITLVLCLSDSKPSKWDGLNLNMTAAEMRMRIGSRKKRDPRKDDRMDFRKKFEIIDDL